MQRADRKVRPSFFAICHCHAERARLRARVEEALYCEGVALERGPSTALRLRRSSARDDKLMLSGYIRPAMWKDQRYYVYIMGSYSGTLYTGFTSDIERRVWQHKNHAFDGFSAENDCVRLLYCETFEHVANAITREKQIKRWRREKKEALIRIANPQWKDLAQDWYSSRVPDAVFTRT